MSIKAKIKDVLREYLIENETPVDIKNIDVNELNLEVIEEQEEENKARKNLGVCTAKYLKELLNDVPDDAIVYTERIEDVYFEKYGWETKTFLEGTNDESEFIRSFSSGYSSKRNAVLIYNHY